MGENQFFPFRGPGNQPPFSLVQFRRPRDKDFFFLAGPGSTFFFEQCHPPPPPRPVLAALKEAKKDISFSICRQGMMKQSSSYFSVQFPLPPRQFLPIPQKKGCVRERPCCRGNDRSFSQIGVFPRMKREKGQTPFPFKRRTNVRERKVILSSRYATGQASSDHPPPLLLFPHLFGLCRANVRRPESGLSWTSEEEEDGARSSPFLRGQHPPTPPPPLRVIISLEACLALLHLLLLKRANEHPTGCATDRCG